MPSFYMLLLFITCWPSWGVTNIFNLCAFNVMLFYLLHSTNQTIVSIYLSVNDLYIDMIYIYIIQLVIQVADFIQVQHVFYIVIFQRMKSNLVAINLWQSVYY